MLWFWLQVSVIWTERSPELKRYSFFCNTADTKLAAGMLVTDTGLNNDTSSKKESWLKTSMSYQMAYSLKRSGISCNIMSWHLAHTQDPVNRWLHTRHVYYLMGLMSWHLAHTQDPVNRGLHTVHVCYLLYQDPVNRWLHTVHVCYLPELGAVQQKRVQPLFDFTYSPWS
jgi:hypothetical protein